MREKQTTTQGHRAGIASKSSAGNPSAATEASLTRIKAAAFQRGYLFE
jgi:hypothetical protein